MSLKDVRKARFRMSRGGGTTYDAVQVDDFVDGLALALERGEDVSEMARTATFPLTRGQGYRAIDVDDFLDRVASQAASGTAFEAGPEPSWWQKLLGG